jgi:endonuclease YncB( thermonuclease family)
MKRLLLAIMVWALLLTGNGFVAGQGSRFAVEVATVTKVIDGDTIDVRLLDVGQTSHRVRYIGINTPEYDQPCGSDATAANAALVEGKTVSMLKDVSETDQYGRLLRYVYVGTTFVNAALVADGWAEAVEYPPDTAFAEWFSLLEAQASDGGLGCWPSGVFIGAATTATPTTAPTSGVSVTASGNVNLRGGPGQNYPIAGTLAAGQTKQAVGRNGDWLYLGDGTWVAAWVVTVSGNINTLPTQSAPSLPAPSAPQQPAGRSEAPVSQPPAAQPAQPPAPAFTCDCSKSCSAMASCQEAYFQLQQCGCGKRDGDNDGVPCEDICPGG